jgi:hypothetical protein
MIFCEPVAYEDEMDHLLGLLARCWRRRFQDIKSIAAARVTRWMKEECGAKRLDGNQWCDKMQQMMLHAARHCPLYNYVFLTLSLGRFPLRGGGLAP